MFGQTPSLQHDMDADALRHFFGHLPSAPSAFDVADGAG
jgi:hypothetical protein